MGERERRKLVARYIGEKALALIREREWGGKLARENCSVEVVGEKLRWRGFLIGQKYDKFGGD